MMIINLRFINLSNNHMHKFFLLLACLLPLFLAQITAAGNFTLVESLQSNSTDDPLILRAFSCIISIHPELENYTVADVNEVGDANATEVDYYITLRGTDAAILAAVRFYANQSTFIVSYTKMAINDTNQQSTANNSNSSASNPADANNTQPSGSNPASMQTQSSQGGSISLLGGFHAMESLDDPQLSKAMQYLAKIHPNMINYQLQSVEYQIVTGINFQLHYRGLDQITSLMARMFINLDGSAFLMEFNVSCAVTRCSEEVAHGIYYGTEHVVMTHPQLSSYRLAALDIEDASTSLTFMATFQNQALKMRALSQIRISKTTEILSFYSYNYS